MGLVEKYAPTGKATGERSRGQPQTGFEQNSAEIVADQAVRLLKSDQLFLLAGRELE